MMNYIYSEVERIIKKYKSRNPYEILDAIGAITKISYAYSADGLKGYCTEMNRTSYVVINGKLSETDQKIVAGHEAGHLILHRDQILSSPACTMRDFNLYDNRGRLEMEANSFLADFIVSDKSVIESIKSGCDFFASARELYIPPEILSFKLYSMMHRGYKVKTPVDLDSRFLGK